MGDGGKGSRARPFSVDHKTFDANWESIFGKKTAQPTDQQPVDVITEKDDKQNES